MTITEDAPKTERKMTDEHKAAMAEGRRLSRVMTEYLVYLLANKPKRGRKRTPESIQGRITKIEQELETADPLKKVNLIQEKINLEGEISAGADEADGVLLEEAFIMDAKSYSDAQVIAGVSGISYDAWRQIGVPADILAKAGITRK